MVPKDMLAMEADPRAHTLLPVRRPVPEPGPGEILLRVRCCGVCRVTSAPSNVTLPASAA